MRNVVLTTALLALPAGLILAQQIVPAPAPAPAAPWAQKLFYGVTSHDFGTVPYGAQLKYRFKMKNIYDVPLAISEIRRTCGCVSFTPNPPVGAALKPNEQGWVDITMDAHRFKGPKAVTLYITVGGGQFGSTAAIVITANAREDVTFNPGSINFGIVRQGQSVTQAANVEYEGNLGWRIIQIVKNADAPFTVEPTEIYRRTEGVIKRVNKVGYSIAVTLKPSAPPGPFHEELTIKTNDGNPPLVLVVEGNVQASLSVAPNVVNLGTIKKGAEKTQRVQVRGDRPFRIVGLDGGSSAITAEMPASASDSHILTLKCRPDQPGDWHKQLTIRTDLDGGAAATVLVEAKVEP
jgi:hypothetical protein